MRAAFLSLLLCCGVCRGDFVLDITEPALGSAVEFTFFGGGVATADATVTELSFSGLGEFYPSTATFTAYKGSAAISNLDTGQTASIGHVFMSDADGGIVSFLLNSPLSFVAGETLAGTSDDWGFSPGIGSFIFEGFPYLSPVAENAAGAPGLGVRVGGHAAVPEASPFLVGSLVCGVLGLLHCCRRSRLATN